MRAIGFINDNGDGCLIRSKVEQARAVFRVFHHPGICRYMHWSRVGRMKAQSGHAPLEAEAVTSCRARRQHHQGIDRGGLPGVQL